VQRGGPDECWEWTAYRFTGYGRIKVGKRVIKAHRVSWELAHGPITGGLFVLHHCDNPPCVNPAHLYLGNGADNARDRGDRDRHPRGERSATARLTEAQVIEILRASAAGESRVSLGRRFGVHPTTVKDIALGRRWAHLQAVPARWAS